MRKSKMSFFQRFKEKEAQFFEAGQARAEELEEMKQKIKEKTQKTTPKI